MGRDSSQRERLALTPVDILVAGACLVLSAAALVVSDEPGARAADGAGIALLAAASVPLIWRRREPVAVATLSVLITYVYLLAGYPGGPSSLPVLIALYSLAVGGHRSWARGVVVVFAGSGVAYRALVENDPSVAIVISAALYVLVLLLGDVVHSRQALRDEVRERLRAAAEKREVEAQRRIVQERLHIARDVHDVVAHTLAAVGVQAAVVADLLEDDPPRARAALATLRSACSDAVDDLRTSVAPLREDGGAPRSLPNLVGLPDLVLRLSSETLNIDLDLADDVVALAPEHVQSAAYRIVQEALTNIIRHAGATEAVVTVRTRGPALLMTITDDGVGPTPDSLEGFGLLGMRERAEGVGGTLDAGLSARGGFRVEAWLPLTEGVEA